MRPVQPFGNSAESAEENVVYFLYRSGCRIPSAAQCGH
jgi:hypothetical protein